MAASRSPWLSLADLKITRTLSVAARWKANLTGGNRNDITQLIPLVDAVPPIRRRRGRPGLRPRELFADRGHDHDMYRRPLRAGASPRASPAVESPTARGSAAVAGWSSAASPGCMPRTVAYPRRHPSRPAPVGLRADLLPPPAVVLTRPWVNGDSQGSGQRTLGRRRGKGYVDAGTSPPVWAKSLLTTFQVPSMRTSWK
jgi:hypothetical protein